MIYVRDSQNEWHNVTPTNETPTMRTIVAVSQNELANIVPTLNDGDIILVYDD